jgi:F420-dependent oxidoreductase-like protein
MRIRVFVEAHRGATYDDQLRMARCAEDGGFEGFFRADHYLAFTDAGGDPGLPGPTDAWLTLAALARETSRIRLGTLVTSATFRPPGALAIAVAQVDQMSRGRVELGLGAGWYEREHRAYGIEFPPVGTRFDRLTEQLEIVTGLWATPEGERFTFHGDHYELVDAPALPKPVQRPGPPIIIGGRGPKRTPELAARFGAEYNVPFTTVANTARQYDAVLDACARLGRAKPPTFSAGLLVYCGRSAAEIAYRSRPRPVTSVLPPEDALTGPPAQVVDRIGEFAAIGAEVIYLRVDLHDLDHAILLASEVLPQLS